MLMTIITTGYCSCSFFGAKMNRLICLVLPCLTWLVRHRCAFFNSVCFYSIFVCSLSDTQRNFQDRLQMLSPNRFKKLKKKNKLTQVLIFFYRKNSRVRVFFLKV